MTDKTGRNSAARGRRMADKARAGSRPSRPAAAEVRNDPQVRAVYLGSGATSGGH